MPSEKMWAIVGTHGLYAGTWFLRVDAIANHVHDTALIGDPEVSRQPEGGGNRLSPEQKELWLRRQAAGDRPVKVTVTWE